MFRIKIELKNRVINELLSDGVDPDLVHETFVAVQNTTDDISQLLKNIAKMIKTIPANSPFQTTLQRELFQGTIFF